LDIKKISSRLNPNIKHAKELLDFSKVRNIHREFIIEGCRLCCEALNNKIKIKQCFFTTEALEKHKDLIQNLIKSADESFELDNQVLKKISDIKSPQGVACICKMLDKFDYLNKIKKVDNILILENLQNPTNLGTILRTADALGINEVYLSKDCCDVYSPKVLRGSMGAVFRLPFYIFDDLATDMKKIKSLSVHIYAAVPDSSALHITKIKRREKIAIAIGNEGKGLTQSLLNFCDERITIPMTADGESLNAAVAAGIIIWEMKRSSIYS
jgi:TrmH family RNA methyltransferase